MEVHDSLEGKLFGSQSHSTKHKADVEFKVGDSLTKKTGAWAYVEQTIDRIKNWYHKKVVEKASGKVLREVDEPLSDHQNRGSAKPQKGIDE